MRDGARRGDGMPRRTTRGLELEEDLEHRQDPPRHCPANRSPGQLPHVPREPVILQAEGKEIRVAHLQLDFQGEHGLRPVTCDLLPVPRGVTTEPPDRVRNRYQLE
jgi:hypothetical protein